MAYDPAKNVRIIDKPIIWDTVRKEPVIAIYEGALVWQVKSPLINPEMIISPYDRDTDDDRYFDVLIRPTLRGRRNCNRLFNQCKPIF